MSDLCLGVAALVDDLEANDIFSLHRLDTLVDRESQVLLAIDLCDNKVAVILLIFVVLTTRESQRDAQECNDRVDRGIHGKCAVDVPDLGKTIVQRTDSWQKDAREIFQKVINLVFEFHISTP